MNLKTNYWWQSVFNKGLVKIPGNPIVEDSEYDTDVYENT